MSASPSRRRSSRLIVLPFALLALLAVLWTGGWFLAANEAGKAVDRWFAAEAARGREIACADRSIEGFPFRIELRCTSMTVAARTPDGPLHVAAGPFVAVAMVYNPKHVILQVNGPVRLGPEPANPTLELTFESAEASVIGMPGEPEQLSVVLQKLAVNALTGQPRQLLAADRFEAHGRKVEDAARPDVFDVVARLDSAVSADFDALAGESAPLYLEAQAEISAASLLRGGPSPERLRAWAAAGGAIRLALLRLTHGSAAVDVRGDLALDAAGMPTGLIDLTVAGLDRILEAAQRVTGVASAGQVRAISGVVMMLGKASEIDGRRASSYAVRLADGSVAVGPMKIGGLRPLF